MQDLHVLCALAPSMEQYAICDSVVNALPVVPALQYCVGSWGSSIERRVTRALLEDLNEDEIGLDGGQWCEGHNAQTLFIRFEIDG